MIVCKKFISQNTQSYGELINSCFFDAQFIVCLFLFVFQNELNNLGETIVFQKLPQNVVKWIRDIWFLDPLNNLFYVFRGI